ncbi:MAG: hypothetical protein AAF558_15680 [Verrucomicrobiota bacterium]
MKDLFKGLGLIFVFLSPLTEITKANTPTFQITLDRITEIRSTESKESELQIYLKLSGENVASALEAGTWQLDRAEDNLGKPIEFAEGFAKTFLPIRKRPGLSADQETGILKLRLALPARSSTHLNNLSGSVALRVYRYQIVPIPDILQLTNKTIDNPLFKTHRIQVHVIDPRHAFPGYTKDDEADLLKQRATAIRVEGETQRVKSFLLQDSQSEMIAARYSSFGGGGSTVFSAISDTPLATDTQGSLMIPIDPQEIRIPFTLRNISLP